MAASRVPTAAELRREFLLREDVTFLNHGSFGACPRVVLAKAQRRQRELEAEPVDFLSLRRRFPSLMREARATLADHVGAEADDLVYVPNATTGLNVVIRSLPLAPGDEVLSTDHEYGALDRAWRFVCERRGARYVRRPLPLPLASHDEAADAVWSGVTDRTRVLFVSHLTSATALVLPVAELVRRARARGLLTVVDGAHAPGQLDLDLASLGADFYAGNCHKWLCAPKGSAFLWARREVQDLLAPLVVSWGWRSDDPGPSRFVDEQEWAGTRDPAAWLAVPAAIRFQAERSWPAVRARCHELAAHFRREAARLTGLAPLCPDGPDWFVQMATVPLPACDEAALGRWLREERRIEVPTGRWNDLPWLRISVQGYNDADDVGRLLDALRDWLAGAGPGRDAAAEGARW
jgi:isopenicillin-N epimerase